jgi:hypothetical protein
MVEQRVIGIKKLRHTGRYDEEPGAMRKRARELFLRLRASLGTAR